jgi:hypothetical protein
MEVTAEEVKVEHSLKTSDGTSTLSILLLAVGIFYGIFSTNVFLTIFGVLSLFVIYKLLWRSYEPPVLFFCLSFQWLQAFTRVIQANLLDMHINDFRMSDYAFSSVACALMGLVLLALGIYLSMGIRAVSRSEIHEQVLSLDPKQLFFLYLIFLTASPFIHLLAKGGLAQIIHAFSSFKWVIYAALAYTAFLKNEGKIFFLAAFLIELVSGFTGYFSSFKEVIFITAIVYFTTEQKVSISKLAMLSPLIAVFGIIFILWTGVKSEYRDYLNGDSVHQVVTVSKTEALEYLLELVKNFDFDRLPDETQKSLDRLSYTDMLMYVQDYVPKTKPYQMGKLWGGGVSHILMPRFLFPNKPVLDDSAITNEYTGMGFSGKEQGTSISLGYFAESYVDFGIPGMFVPIFLFGLLIGRIYRFFLEKESILLVFRYGSVIAVLSGFKLFEKVISKQLGGVIMAFLVYNFILLPYIIPRVQRLLSKPKP